MRATLPQPTQDHMIEAVSSSEILIHVNPFCVKDVLPELISACLASDPTTWLITHTGLDAHGWDVWTLLRDVL